MMKYQLRDYQLKLLENISDSLNQGHKTLAQLATGGGKSIVLGSLAKQFAAAKENGSVIVVAHRNELIEQLAATLERVTGSQVGILKAGHKQELWRQIQVASVQSLNEKRLAELYRIPELIIIDEAHHTTVKSNYTALVNKFPSARVAGFTATPVRGDKQLLSDCYDNLVCGVEAQQLFDEGYLCQYKLFAPEKRMEGGKIAVSGFNAGDYDLRDLQRKNQVGDLSKTAVDAYLKYASGKTCIAFCMSVEYSIAQAEAYQAAGIKAKHLDGNTPKPERAQALRDLAEGKLHIITNCALFGEGVDIPSIECVQIIRMTKSLGLWLQMVGRALRPSPNKECAVIIDHGSHHEELGLPETKRYWSLHKEDPKLPKAIELREKQIIDLSDQMELTVVALEQTLAEIDRTKTLPMTLAEFKRLVKVCETNKYKPGWLYYRLKESNASAEIWKAHKEYSDKQKVSVA